MYASTLMLVCCWSGGLGDDRVQMIQVYPARRGVSSVSRSPNQKKAVILLQGLDLRDDGETFFRRQVAKRHDARW